MKKIFLFMICLCSCLNSPLSANEDMLKLFQLAVKNNDVKLVTEVIGALLTLENHNETLLNALAKYNDSGKLDFALHNAIKDRNLLASVVLAHHSKNINTKKDSYEEVWPMQNNAVTRPGKTPIELALEFDMIEIMPYLLTKKADIYDIAKSVNTLIKINYLSEKENPEYFIQLGYPVEKKICVKSKNSFWQLPKNLSRYSRNLIGAAIAQNRLDVLEIFQNFSNVNWEIKCVHLDYQEYTPLQFALAIKRYEIAQFLIDHGAKIE